MYMTQEHKTLQFYDKTVVFGETVVPYPGFILSPYKSQIQAFKSCMKLQWYYPEVFRQDFRLN